ncbi:CubicO group peptidase (beta-lactamase class C family) [Undibacterium pigrum]|uniref:CubicO group peptidase (Beta-lactamase class C family) n=2 Tax=Undibacterium pigrum TaxID=401470 RepID=A0A318J103_9BURK|nr:CubicO group peptidase (beta-lactamase class C family) [Undibacterium pigrum]
MSLVLAQRSKSTDPYGRGSGFVNPESESKLKMKTALRLLPMKLLMATLALGAFQAHAATSMSDAEILSVLKQRIDTEKKGVGIVVGVVDEKGSRVISYGYANLADRRLVDADTLFELGSITSVFTGVTLMEMAEKSEIRLKDPLAKYLPDTVTVPSSDDRKITLADLSAHRSGLPALPANLKQNGSDNPYTGFTTSKAYEFLSGYQLKYDVGSRYEYSSFGSGLLAQVLSQRAGTDYETLVKNRIAAPLGMTATGVTLNADLQKRMATGYSGKTQFSAVSGWSFSSFEGAGGLRSSANDMLKFVAANMGQTNVPLKDTMRKLQEPFEPGNRLLLVWGGYNNKFGSSILAQEGKTGGYSSYMAFDKKAGKGVVILSNADISVSDIGNKIINSEFPLAQ